VNRRAVLTGRAVLSPLGAGFVAHAEAVLAGRSAVATVSGLADLGLGCTRGAQVPAADLQPLLSRLPRKQQKLYNRAALFAMLGASLAMEDAGLAVGAGDPDRFGVLLGVNVLVLELDVMVRYIADAESPTAPGAFEMARANPYCMKQINPLDYSLKTQPNLAAGHVAIAHNARGMCRGLLEGGPGGLHAIGQAFRHVQEGDLDAVLAGGTDCLLDPLLVAPYAGARIFASDADPEPGPVPGEGCAVFVVEEAARARARGVPVHGEVLGYASMAGDGTLLPESDVDRLGARATRAIRQAIDEAGAEPDLVCLHGDGGTVSAAAEARALDKALGERAQAVPRLAMKRLHGDLGAASAAVELAAALAFLERGLLPAAARASGTAPVRPRSALVLALGTFGECTALVVGGAGSREAT
jgi:3-oxoacyl-[acyl-carrier-protein] synthase II